MANPMSCAISDKVSHFGEMSGLAALLALWLASGPCAARSGDGVLTLAQAPAPLRVVLLPGRSSASHTSGRGVRVLERQAASLTRILRSEPGVVLT